VAHKAYIRALRISGRDVRYWPKADMNWCTAHVRLFAAVEIGKRLSCRETDFPCARIIWLSHCRRKDPPSRRLGANQGPPQAAHLYQRW